MTVDMMGNELHEGDKVHWFDEEFYSNDYTDEEREEQHGRVWTISYLCELNDDMICISDEHGDAEVYADEVQLIN